MKKSVLKMSVALMAVLVSFANADIRKEFYRNNRVKSETSYKGVNRDGKYTSYYESGKKKEQGNYKNNEKNGQWKKWNENGKLVQQSEYKDGKRVGNWKEWNDLGKLIAETKVKDAVKESGFAKVMDAEGRLAYEVTIENGAIKKIDIFKNGKKLVSKPGAGVQGKDGKTYKTVIINGQEWMAENLAEKVLPNQFGIGFPGSKTYNEMNSEAGLSLTCESDAERAPFCKLDGQYYVWGDAVNACPEGWHLPSREEFEQILPMPVFNHIYSLGSNAYLGIKGWGIAVDAINFSALPSDMYWISEKTNYGSMVVSITQHNDAKVKDSKVDLFNKVRCLKNSSEYQKELDESRALEEQFSQQIESQSGVLKDSRDGKTYRYIIIGNKKWMRDNLNYEMQNSSCVEKDSKDCERFGRVYDRGVLDNPKEICPEGWKLPSKADFEELINLAGNDYKKSGTVLRSVLWDGTDDLGFSAMPTDLVHFKAGYYSSTKDEGSITVLRVSNAGATFDAGHGKDGIRCIEAN